MNSSVVNPPLQSLSARITNSILNQTASQLSTITYEGLQAFGTGTKGDETGQIQSVQRDNFRKHLVSNIIESISIVAEKFQLVTSH